MFFAISFQKSHWRDKTFIEALWFNKLYQESVTRGQCDHISLVSLYKTYFATLQHWYLHSHAHGKHHQTLWFLSKLSASSWNYMMVHWYLSIPFWLLLDEVSACVCIKISLWFLLIHCPPSDSPLPHCMYPVCFFVMLIVACSVKVVLVTAKQYKQLIHVCVIHMINHKKWFKMREWLEMLDLKYEKWIFQKRAEVWYSTSLNDLCQKIIKERCM